jgi:hypothetical protein
MEYLQAVYRDKAALILRRTIPPHTRFNKTTKYFSFHIANMRFTLFALAAAVLSVSAHEGHDHDDEDCQATYTTCVASGRTEQLCGCDLATCFGEDNARTRDACAAASASLSSTVTSATATAPAAYPVTSSTSAAPSATATGDCQSQYSACTASGRSEELCGCDLATCSGQDNARTRERCAALSSTMSSAVATSPAATHSSMATSVMGGSTVIAPVPVPTGNSTMGGAKPTGTGVATSTLTPYVGAASTTGFGFAAVAFGFAALFL